MNGPACSGCCRPLVIHRPSLGFHMTGGTEVRMLHRPLAHLDIHRVPLGTRQDNPDQAVEVQGYSVLTSADLGTAEVRHIVLEHLACIPRPELRLEVVRKALFQHCLHRLCIAADWRPNELLEQKQPLVVLPHVQPAFRRYHPALRPRSGIESECRNRQVVLTLARHRFAGRFPDSLLQHCHRLGWVLLLQKTRN